MNSSTITIATQADKSEIDRYLLGNDQSLPYHHMHWLEAIKSTYGHEYLYLIAKELDNIVGVLPICIFKSLLGKKSFCSLPFCDVGGFVTDRECVEEALLKFSIEQLVTSNCDLLEIRQRVICSETAENYTNRKVSMLLDLPASSEALMQGFKSKLRSQIRKAEKNGLSFDCSSDRAGVEAFFEVFSRNMHYLGSPVHSITWFKTLQREYQDNLVIGKVRYGEKVVGAGILMFSGHNVSIPWASTLREYNHLAPNMWLYWSMLRIACEHGCNVFDFGRSTYQEGTYKFKEQWGARPVLLEWRKLNSSGQSLETPSSSPGKLRQIAENLWRLSPLFVANFLGPRLRKHISL